MKHLQLFEDFSVDKYGDIKSNFHLEKIQKLKTNPNYDDIVVAIDTSSSHSGDFLKGFLMQIMRLAEKSNTDRVHIIYCSGDIDGVDVVDVKSGANPDLRKWAKIGGNSGGFVPPFKYVWSQGIKPSAFIYLTDTGGDMPTTSDFVKYDIKDYEDYLYWCVDGGRVYSIPEFGEILMLPYDE